MADDDAARSAETDPDESAGAKVVVLRVETTKPGEDRLSIDVTSGFVDGVADAFEEGMGDGAAVDRDGRVIDLSAASDLVMQSVQVIGPMAVVVEGIVRSLSLWWHRNSDKKVKLTVNGREIELSGMSQAEMRDAIAMARKEWDDEWYRQFPQLPPRTDPADGSGSGPDGTDE